MDDIFANICATNHLIEDPRLKFASCAFFNEIVGLQLEIEGLHLGLFSEIHGFVCLKFPSYAFFMK